MPRRTDRGAQPRLDILMDMTIIQLERRDPQPETASLASLTLNYAATGFLQIFNSYKVQKISSFLFFFGCHVFLTAL